MNKLFIGILASILAAGVTFFSKQHRAIVALRAENVSLQQEIDNSPPLVEKNGRLSNQVTPVQVPLASATDQLAELGRLKAEMAARKDEIEKLRALLAARTGPSPAELPTNIIFLNYPKESWSFAGYDSPEAALQTMFWATREGKLDALRESLTADEQARRRDREWRGKTDAEIAAEGVQRLAKATGFQILGLYGAPDTNMTFYVHIDGLSFGDQPMTMRVRKVGNEYKANSFEIQQGLPYRSRLTDMR